MKPRYYPQETVNETTILSTAVNETTILSTAVNETTSVRRLYLAPGSLLLPDATAANSFLASLM
jgi:hypothetical protein